MDFRKWGKQEKHNRRALEEYAEFVVAVSPLFVQDASGKSTPLYLFKLTAGWRSGTFGDEMPIDLIGLRIEKVNSITNLNIRVRDRHCR